jgi:hypothetical protein
MGRAALILFILIGLAWADTARSLELHWANGATNLTVADSAVTCALFVAPSPGDSLFQSPWRLLWRGTSETNSPITLLGGASSSPVPGPVSVFTALTLADSIAHMATVVFQTTDSVRYTLSARYILRVTPDLRARITVATLVVESKHVVHAGA